MMSRPRGLMAKALVFGTKDCAFESHRGRCAILPCSYSSNMYFILHIKRPKPRISSGPEYLDKKTKIGLSSRGWMIEMSR